MSSKTQPSQADTSHWLVAAACICFFILAYWQAIVQFFAALVSVLFGMVILVAYVGGALFLLRRKRRTRVGDGIEHIDLTDIEEADMDDIYGSPEKKKREREQITRKKTFSLRIDRDAPYQHLLEIPVHANAELDSAGKSFLLGKGYEEREFVPLGKVRRELFLIKQQPPKSFEHTFLLYGIYARALEYGLHTTVTPEQDLSLTHKGKTYGVCVVTPLDLRKHKYLSRTAERLSKDCAGWWLVVTQSAYAKSFQRYGDVLKRNQIETWLHTTFSSPSP